MKIEETPCAVQHADDIQTNNIIPAPKNEKGDALRKKAKDSTGTFLKSVKEIDDATAQVHSLIDALKENVNSGMVQTDGGISLLDVKNQMMISYLMNIVYLIAKKCHGGSIEGDCAVERMVEIRTVLERIRPLEHKLKYMFDKLLKTALTGVDDKNDSTNFRANPEAMIDNVDDSESESEKEDAPSGKKSEKKSGIYVPPRLAPVHYDEEESVEARRQKHVERAKRHALHSSVVQELREEYLDTPLEVSHSSSKKRSLDRRQQKLIQYEEEHFTRLPISKKNKQSNRHLMTVKNIGDELTQFEDIRVLEDEEAFSKDKKRKRKLTGKNSHSKKGFKKRKTHR